MGLLFNMVRPPNGGTVLSPFGGAGTDALVAMTLGMNFIVIEREPAHVQLIERRICEYIAGNGLGEGHPANTAESTK
jgi:DNA modification methylase